MIHHGAKHKYWCFPDKTLHFGGFWVDILLQIMGKIIFVGGGYTIHFSEQMPHKNRRGACCELYLKSMLFLLCT